MTDVSITPEDRDRLVKTKFSDLLKELGPTALKEMVDTAVDEKIAALRGGSQQQGGQQQQQSAPPAQEPQGRKRSAFDIAIANALGIG